MPVAETFPAALFFSDSADAAEPAAQDPSRTTPGVGARISQRREAIAREAKGKADLPASGSSAGEGLEPRALARVLHLPAP